MSKDRQPEPRSALEVVRVGGGVSARLGAFVVVGALAAVVWVGMSNRGPTVGAPPTQRPAIAGSTAIPAPTHPPTPAPTTPPSTYAVSATIGNRAYLAALDESRPGRMFATLRVPMPPDEASGVLTITELFAGDFWNNPVSVGDWTMPLDPLFTARRDPEVVIDEAMPALPHRDDVPTKVRGGFGLKVYAENDLLFGILSIEVILNPVVVT